MEKRVVVFHQVAPLGIKINESEDN